MNLTPKQRQFISEYLIDKNATQAAIRAGYSPRRATVTGAELVAKSNIRAEIDLKLAEIRKKAEITAERVQRELARIAFSDIRGVVRWDKSGVQLRPSFEDGLGEGLVDDETAPAIADISHSETQHGTHVKVKMYDKLKALEMLGKDLGMFDAGGGASDKELPLVENEDYETAEDSSTEQ